MRRRSLLSTSILSTILCATIALCACGGKNGLMGGGGGATLSSVSLTPLNPSLTLVQSPPSTVAFDVIANYSFGHPQDVTDQMTWLSADTTVATINTKGVATAVGSGRVIITGTIQDPQTLKIFTVSTILTVVPQLTGITVSPASAQIAKGTAQQFTATGKYNDGTSADITALVAWNSSQSEVASVSASPGTQGLAVAAAPGSTSISASLGSVSGSASSLKVSNANLVSISVAPASSTVPLGTSQQLTATGTFDDQSTQDLNRIVTWSTATTNSLVARVSATGMVTGLGLGSETITVTVPSSLSSTAMSASAGVSVDESSVTGINVLPVGMVMLSQSPSAAPVMANGTERQMRAVATFNDGSTLDVTDIQGIAWSSTDTTVAYFVPTTTGLLATSNPGSTTVTAALGSHQGSIPLTVLAATLQSLVVAPNNAQVAQGGIQNVVALATFLAPDNITVFQQDVSNAATWSGDAIASVSYVNGLQELATGASNGTSNISANFTVPGAGAVQASATLNVSTGQLGAISLVPGSAAVPLDGSQQFRAVGNFTDGSQGDLSLLANWTSAQAAVATVSPFGFAMAAGPGQTNISAGYLNQSGSAPMSVNSAALAKIDICAATVANPLVNCPPLDPGTPPPGIAFANQTQFGLVAIGTFTDGSRQDLTNAVRWTSADPDVATVSNDPGFPGITTGVGQRGVLSGGILGGTAVITATAAGIGGSAIASVSAATPLSLAITPANSIVALGVPQQCKVTATFSDGSKQDATQSVQWSSLNPDIAIVYPGGLAYTTGTGMGSPSQDPSGLVVATELVMVTMVNPSTTNVFPWPVGSVFQFQNLTVSSGDVSLLDAIPLTILSETDPADSQHVQPCKPGQNCDIWFAPPPLPPAAGTYTVTGGTAQASAVIQATMNVFANSTNTWTQVSGATTLTVQ